MSDEPRPDDELLAELRELGSIDLESVSVKPDQPLPRPALDDVDAVERERDTVVVVTLSFGGRRLVGTSRSGTGSVQVDRAAAEASLDALAQLVPPGRVEWYVDRAEHLAPASEHRPAVVHVAVAARTAQGEEILVGAAVVRDDPAYAAARAALDAVNRRLEALLGG